MNTAEYIIKRLEELDVNEFFGIPSDYNYSLIYAVEHNTNTNWIGCAGSQNAGYAADGYARIKGYASLITSYGTDEVSALNAISGCMAENIPVFCISGLPSTDNINSKAMIHNNFQDVNYENYINMYKNVTAATAFLTKDNAKLEIDRLLKTMVREKKPVYAAIPEDIALMEISEHIVSYDWISDRNVLGKVSSKIAEKINKSERPVIIGDVLVKRYDAEVEFKEFTAKSGIPVSNFIMGTNLINMEADNYIGGYFGKYKNPLAQKYIAETDCLITVGAINSDVNTLGFELPHNINDHIAIYGTYTYIDGKRYDNVKMSELLEEITNLVIPKEIEFNKPNIGIKHQETDNEGVTISYLYSRIQEFIKDNDIIIAENGSSLYGAVQMKFPESVDFNAQVLWNSSGWATPAVLGAALAKPQTRVILITGEGAHQQTAMEIGNMLRYGVKPVIIVINNNGYASGRLCSSNSNDEFNDVMQVNYAKFARVFGGDVWSTKVATAEDFDKALRVTQIMNKLCYIEVCTEPSDMLPLAKDFLRGLMSELHNVKVPETNVNNIYSSINDVVLSPSEGSCEYETVVHKVFNENMTEGEE